MMQRACLILLATCFFGLQGAAQGVDFDVPGHLSFESGKGISAEHCKTGSHSLKWSWKKAGARFSLHVEVPYLPSNPNPEETSVPTFVFWAYSPVRLDGTLHVEFLKEGRLCCGFPYKLGFTGWRGAWVAFDRDMEGTPETGMDEIRFRIEGPRRGTLYFDSVIPSAFEDVRHHTPDWQAPFINKGTTSHWLMLQEHWNKRLDIPVPEAITRQDRDFMDTVRSRLVEITASGRKGYGIAEAREVFIRTGIRHNPDGTLTGKPVFFTRYGETFINLGVKDAAKRFEESGQLLRTFNDDLFRIALGWRDAEDPAAKAEFGSIYVDMVRHLLDQGFAAGSAMGTLHHLGYSMRNFYTAPLIMRDVLREAGLLEEVQQAMEWFSGAGEVKHAPLEPGMDIDAFNTYLLSRVAALVMLEDGPYKYSCMKALSRWIDNGFKYTSGTKACFKADGTVFHHRKAYPAYAVGGFDGAVKAVWLLHGTPFAVSGESHSALKGALLEMRFYCNLASFPLAMSGRHPDGLGALVPAQYALLAEAGSPDGKEGIDRELAAAYLRLGPDNGKWVKRFKGAGIEAEQSPQGIRNYGYNCSLSARKDDWLVTIAGHSRYLWATETYVGANHYGRYLTHGSMEILADSSAPGGDGKHISVLGSGYRVAGYDWCHIPGTTAAVIPMEQMRAHVLNVDEYSGYEEMLLSDEWFAGGVGHTGGNGAFAMKLHEHDKYNGSLRARKSFFVFGDAVVCIGSDITSDVRPVHTTLFQNALDGPAETTSSTGGKVLRDRFGNAWIVAEGRAESRVSLQRSFHEETDAPTEGWFEKAYLVNEGPSYEYLVLIHPTDGRVEACSSAKPYEVLSLATELHAVRDIASGTTAAAVFEMSAVDSLVVEASPCMLAYSLAGRKLDLSVSNPDLALYEGPADEVYDAEGKRVERSVYSRKWIDNDCAPTLVSLALAGLWDVKDAAGSAVECVHRDGFTFLVFHTAEARTERIKMERR